MRLCGNKPSSKPPKNTIGNSRPFAACNVINVTLDSSCSKESTSFTSATCSKKSSTVPFGFVSWKSLATDKSSPIFSARAWSCGSVLSSNCAKYPVLSRIDSKISSTVLSSISATRVKIRIPNSSNFSFVLPLIVSTRCSCVNVINKDVPFARA